MNMRTRAWLLPTVFTVTCGLAAETQGELSLRPCRNSSDGKSQKREGGQSLLHVISLAYNIEEHVVDGPEWIRTECVAYTMIPGKQYSPEEFQPAFRRGLNELLHFRAHKEQKEVDTFVLRLPVDGTPFKLRPVDGRTTHGEFNYGSMQLSNGTLAAFAQQLAIVLRRPVIDETGLSSAFNIDLRWRGADLQQAVKDQLGLELVLLKRPVERFVIDHVEKWPQN